MHLHFKTITKNDLPTVTAIYKYYVLNSTATFDLKEVDENKLAEMTNNGNLKYPSFVILHERETCGFCYLSPYRKKAAYAISAEITVYLHPNYVGKGLGSFVLDYMESVAKSKHINNLIAGITQENENSIVLFEKAGYLKCGHIKRVGKKFDRLLDVVFYQKEI